jgi:cytochrome b561
MSPDITDRYTATAVALHWIIAISVIGLVGWGWWMQTIPKLPPGPRVDAFNLHKSFGLLVLALMIVRAVWRSQHPPPPRMPARAWESRAAKGVHWLLYICLFIQPLSGYMGSAFSGYPVKWFGMVLPSWAASSQPLKDLMSTVHLLNSWLLVALIAIHVLAAGKHALIDRDGLLRRIWF